MEKDRRSNQDQICSPWETQRRKALSRSSQNSTGNILHITERLSPTKIVDLLVGHKVKK